MSVRVMRTPWASLLGVGGDSLGVLVRVMTTPGPVSWGWGVTPWAAGRWRTCEANPSIHLAWGHKLEKGRRFWIPREEQGKQMGGDGPSRPRGPLPVLGEAQPTPVSRPVSWAAGATPILPHPCLKALEARPKVASPGLACISRRGALSWPFYWTAQRKNQPFPRCLVPPGSSSSNGPGAGKAEPCPQLLSASHVASQPPTPTVHRFPALPGILRWAGVSLGHHLGIKYLKPAPHPS